MRRYDRARLDGACLLACLLPAAAAAQSGYVAPDGRNRYPGVTIFCPTGTGAQPCNFGGAGATALSVGGTAVGGTNPLPVSDSRLDAAITNNLLGVSIAGTPSVAVSNFPALLSIGNFPATQPVSGAVSVSNLPATQTVAGTVSVGNFPAIQPVSGTVNVGNLPATQTVAGTVSVGNFPATQPVSGTVSVGNLPATQTVAGTVSVANFPATQPVSGTVSLAAGTAGSVTAGGTAGSVAQAIQGITGGVAVPVSGTFWPATQPVSATSLPLPTGAATSAVQASVAPAAATATQSILVGCQAATALPSFTAGQQGAIPCDTSGRPYVVTVPSATNVPSYLQAVTSGGASLYSTVNAAGACIAANIKSSAGMMFGYSLSNTTASPVTVRFFASGTAPSCGAGTPLRRVVVPAGATVGLSTDLGWVFSGGIGVTVTTGSADTDTGTIATAASVLVNVDHK